MNPLYFLCIRNNSRYRIKSLTSEKIKRLTTGYPPTSDNKNNTNKLYKVETANHLKKQGETGTPPDSYRDSGKIKNELLI